LELCCIIRNTLEMIKSLQNGLDPLEFASQDIPEMAGTDIACRLCLSISPIACLLFSMQQGNWVIQILPYQKYPFGGKILELARFFPSDLEWRMIAIPLLKDLRDKADKVASALYPWGTKEFALKSSTAS
jgi:DNA-binding IclR family transcriptional regulator